ncbi:TIR domain-containing adapter molecule 1 [Rhynchocyon petersi]
MVLLALGRDAEARLLLDTLRADAAARLVARQWAGVDLAEETPEEQLDVAWTVARLYHLLAEEQLCPETVREAAYRAALRACRADDPRLPELHAEAHHRCGWDTSHLGGFQSLHSGPGDLLPPSASLLGVRSSPQPIQTPSGWSRACTLRSTGSPASLASDLKISQSPTLPLLTQPRSPPGPSNLCDQPRGSPDPPAFPAGRQEPEQVSWPPSVQTDPPRDSSQSPAPQLPDMAPDPSPAGSPDASVPPESRGHCPVECTEESGALPSLPSSTQSLPSPIWEPTDQPPKDGATRPLSGEDTASEQSKLCPPPPLAPQPSPPSASPGTVPQCPQPPAASSSEPPAPELDLLEQKFYNFVVLHARADEHVALRVRQRLEALGVPDGATFCEDFQVPGRGQLSCLQDAIEHSAFTVLLLTPNFDCRLSLHQVSQALLSSFDRQDWQDSVIPFQPLETPQLSSDTARLLSSLVCLDEHSPLFDRKVRNTFKKQKLQVRKASWTREQEARGFQEQSRRLEVEKRQAAELNSAYSAYLQSYLARQVQVQQLQAAFGTQMSLGTQMPPVGQFPLGVQPPLPTWPDSPQPPLPTWLMGTPPPAVFPPPPAFLPVASLPPQSPGLQPLIIHHAQMVQLGLTNHMWGQSGAQPPEDKTQEAE